MNADVFGLLGSYVEGQSIPARQVSSPWRYSALRHQEEVTQELQDSYPKSDSYPQNIDSITHLAKERRWETFLCLLNN